MKLKIITASIGLILGLLLLAILAHKQIGNIWEIHVTTNECQKHYASVSVGEFICKCAPDTDDNGFSACSVYSRGSRIDTFECSTTWPINTIGCKVKTNVMSGGSADNQENGNQ